MLVSPLISTLIPSFPLILEVCLLKAWCPSGRGRVVAPHRVRRPSAGVLRDSNRRSDYPAVLQAACRSPAAVGRGVAMVLCGGGQRLRFLRWCISCHYQGIANFPEWLATMAAGCSAWEGNRHNHQKTICRTGHIEFSALMPMPSEINFDSEGQSCRFHICFCDMPLHHSQHCKGTKTTRKHMHFAPIATARRCSLPLAKSK